MTLGEEASRSLSGAWGLLRRDPAAPTAFNATLAGVWRSFFAAVLLLPLHLAYLALAAPPGPAEAAGATRWMVHFLIYVIGWAAWPLIAYYMTRLMDCSDKLLGYVVAYNWSQLLTVPFIIGLDVFGRIALPQDVAFFIDLVGFAGVLFYAYMIARQMLGVVPSKAIVLVLMAFLLARVLSDTADFALKLAAPELP
jgi:hypothetical protein